MQRKSLIVGIIVGVVVVAGLIGASEAYGTLSGPSTLEVTTERINTTHAAIGWTGGKPTNGHVKTSVQYRCNGSWMTINTINDSSFSREHLVVAPIYELNKSQMKATLANIPENVAKKYRGVPPKRYKVIVDVVRDGSEARKTIHKRTLGQVCQERQ